MKTIKYRSTGPDVSLLEEILYELGYTDIVINSFFNLDTDSAVKDFQKRHDLIIDGIVGPKTWAKLLKQQASFLMGDKFLSEEDLIDFSKQHNLEMACIKAVNEVESLGRGFLLDGRPKILFEGHIFWKELVKRGVTPERFVNEHTQNILYEKFSKSYYLGGVREYHRLDEAAGLSEDPRFREAAYSSCSWGAFQIMGFHATSIGYSSVEHFAASMYVHEREHLRAFGRFLNYQHLIPYLRAHDWLGFSKRYNGGAAQKYKYDIKLKNAYKRYAVNR